jgi:hypothetical protein
MESSFWSCSFPAGWDEVDYREQGRETAGGPAFGSDKRLPPMPPGSGLDKQKKLLRWKQY